MPNGATDHNRPPVETPPPAAQAGDWRWLPVVAGVLVWLALLGLTIVPGWRTPARAYFPWMLDPLFHDWHVVRLGWDAWAAGVDPLAASGQPFNYPRFVLLVAELGRRVPPNLAGLITAAAFLGAMVWVLRPRTRGQAVLASLLVGSLPVLLLIERGNLDAWAFVLVALGLTGVTMQPERTWVTAVGSLAVVGAALLKLYPAALLPASALFWLGARRVWSVAGFAIWVTWLVTSLDEVVLILQKTTHGLEPAYGRMIAGSRYVFEVVAPKATEREAAQAMGALQNVSLLVCFGGFLLAGYAGWCVRIRLAEVVAAARDRAFFWSGALIYGGTFFLGSNWSYRLVFLALCVPFLWRMTQVGTARPWGLAGLAGITALLVSPSRLPLGLFFAQQAVSWLLAWLLFSGAVALLVADKEEDR